ncbi:TAM domain methyltransferase [Colletotrichum truncatum]|uniref:TAM domain methyltransferase n=1 Tax=Colletotrichum truncatum TaxID=5467 RepID=A0ACC3YFU9_COLTU
MQEPQTDDGASSIGGDVGYIKLLRHNLQLIRKKSFDSTLASLRSSIVDYRIENGRTYHRMSDGNLVHHLWTLTWDGEICLSPKKKTANRVLDVGTGTGIWALDYGENVLGVDLSAIQPGYIPPNCSFEIDDIEKEWTWSTPFDFVFIRSMVGSFSDWQDIIDKAYDNLEPGGYIEMQDMAFPLQCNDDTMKNDWKPLKWTNLLVEATDKLGRSVTVPSTFKQMLEAAGFVDVQERREIWPFNPWPKDAKLRELGTWCQASALSGLEAASLGPFTRVLDWSAVETNVFCAEVRKDHFKIGVHAYYDVYGVYGRKPEKEATETPVA